MLSAIQTPPLFQWPNYVWTYIDRNSPLQNTDKYPLIFNSDTRNCVIFSDFLNPASATKERGTVVNDGASLAISQFFLELLQ